MDYMLVGTAALQSFLVSRGQKLTIDGIFGPKTRKAAKIVLEEWAGSFVTKPMPDNWVDWSDDRKLVAIQQVMFRDVNADPGPIDGLIGPMTRAALERWQNQERSVAPLPKATGPKNQWPRESEAAEFFGPIGKGHTTLKLPYTMKLAWDLSKKVNKITIHSKIAESAESVLVKVRDHYKKDGLAALGLDIFSGCYNPRPKVGTTNTWSMHAYAAAIDFDDTHNQLRWGRDLARLARPDAEFFWQCWEEEGWLSLGRAYNYDWMHVQAVRR